MAERRQALSNVGGPVEARGDLAFRVPLAAAMRAQDEDAELRTALHHHEDAVRKLDLYGRTLIPKAEQSIKATEAAFRTGRASFGDLIDVQRELLAFSLEHERALAERGTRRAQIEMLLGRRLDERRSRPASAPSSEKQGDHHAP